MTKKRIKIPFVTRTVVGVVGFLGIQICMVFFLPSLLAIFSAQATSNDYLFFLISLGATALAVEFMMISLTPRIKFWHDTEEELIDWDIENELFKETSKRRKQSK